MIKLFAKLPHDSTGTTLTRFNDTRAHRYTEFFLIGGNAITKHLKANVYNTYGLNNMDNTGDSSPDAMLARVDTDQLKKRYHMIGAFVNGPRLWTLDWIDVPAGVQRDFNGLKAAWVAEVDLTGMNLKKKGGTAYQPTTVERKTQFGFSAGKPVFILDDPDGQPWVMKSAGLIVNPNEKFEELQDLGSRLKTQPGWRFRVQQLGQELILKPESGVASIVQDELGNTYDLAGPATATTNHKPLGRPAAGQRRDASHGTALDDVVRWVNSSSNQGRTT